LAQEDSKRALYFAHLFAADHILSTAWTVYFGLVWWVYTPHDGAHAINSPAQRQLAATRPSTAPVLTAEERTERAQMIWGREKNKAAIIILLGWLSKVAPIRQPIEYGAE
jgi:hypothetical protein